jgi:hypothetical protein
MPAAGTSQRFDALKEAERKAIRAAIGFLKPTAISLRDRGLAAVGQHPQIVESLRQVGGRVIDDALRFDERAAERELRRFEATGECDNPFDGPKRVELLTQVESAMALAVGRILADSLIRRLWSAYDGSRWAGIRQMLVEEAKRHIDAEYGERDAEFEVKRVELTARRAREMQGKTGGGADTGADTKKKFRPKKPLPENEEVTKLALDLARQLPQGEKSRNQIALEFARGNATKAQSLLRKIRRFPDLKSLVDRSDPKKK